jgi:hypothetical protein
MARPLGLTGGGLRLIISPTGRPIPPSPPPPPPPAVPLLTTELGDVLVTELGEPIALESADVQ